jgi:hypothetical protein
MSAVISTNIPANQSLSGGVDLGNHTIYSIEFDDNFNASTITFQAKSTRFEDEEVGVGEPNPEQWKNVYDKDGAEIALTVVKNTIMALPIWFSSIRYIRVRAGTAAAPVNVPATEIRFIAKEL